MDRGLSLEQKMIDALASLGDSHNQVADTLRAEGIKGTPIRSFSCPVSRYVARVTGADWVTVSQSGGLTAYDAEGRVNVPVPSAVANFITFFDSHRWPDLIEERPGSPVDVKTHY